MKAGWKTVKLGEATEINSGLWKGEEGALVEAKVYRATNFSGNGELSDDNLVTIPVEVKKLAKRSLQPGDILLEKSGGGPNQPVGRVGYFDKHEPLHSFSNFTSRIRVLPGVAIDAKYLHKYLFWAHLRGDTSGMQNNSTNIRNLDLDKYRAIEIPLPPLAEQKQIVALLDEAFAGIDEAKAKAEANLASARKLTENYFQSIIAQQGQDWAQKQLLELCDIKHGYAFEGEFFSPKGDYVLLTPGNFYERGGYRDRGEKQKYYTGEIPRDYVLSKGDLLVAMTEQAAGLLGSPIIVPESDKFLHNQRLGLVTKKPGAAWTNRFFFHIFNSLPVRKSIHDSATGVKVRHTSPKKIGDVVVMVPSSTSEQDKIVETMESLDEHMKSLSSLYQRKQIRLVQLKQSLLTQAFAGELTA